MSSSTRLILVAGVRIPDARLDANDGHTRDVAETVPICANGHNYSSPFCPKCGAVVSDVQRTRTEPYTLRQRLRALPDVDGDEGCLHGGCATSDGGYLWELGQERHRPEWIVGVCIPLPSTSDYELRSIALDATGVTDAMARGRALCESVGLADPVALHVAAWISC